MYLSISAESTLEVRVPWMQTLAVFILGSKPPIWLSMCRQLHKIVGIVDDAYYCAIHSQGVLKPGNSWSQQSVHHFICGRQDEQLESHWDPGDASVSSVSVAVFVGLLL